MYRIARYLLTADPWRLDCFDIRAEADGFVQDRARVPRVPLVTEELLDPARSLLKALYQLETTLTGSSELREKEGLPPLPSSHGNTITDIDIVLDQAGIGVP